MSKGKGKKFQEQRAARRRGLERKKAELSAARRSVSAKPAIPDYHFQNAVNILLTRRRRGR